MLKSLRVPQSLLQSLPRRSVSQLLPLRMRLVQFQSSGSVARRIGLELGAGGSIIDLNAFDPTLPCGMREFLEVGDSALQAAKRALDSGQHVLSRSQLTLLAPITNPEKVICVGMNYVDHCLEQNVPVPKEPIIFSKFPSSIIGPTDPIILPAESQVSARGQRETFTQIRNTSKVQERVFFRDKSGLTLSKSQFYLGL
ncbi:hypothetical protein FKM82_012170 [Ascaphus truei]